MQTEFNADGDHGIGAAKTGSGLVRDLLNSSTDEERAGYLRLLHERGETPDEVAELSGILRSMATLSRLDDVSDIVGTGGDGKNTINVSTAASFVAATSGIRIAKHGNFGATSNKGSADFLKFLGYNFDMTQDELARRVSRTSFAFILAPRYNESFARFAKARKMLPFRTVFNFLGPLTNPADPDNVMLGVTDGRVSSLYANYLSLNSKSGCVVHSEDGMDELSPYTYSNIVTVFRDSVEASRIDPREMLGERIGIEKISSVDPMVSFRMTAEGLGGSRMEVSKFIALNSALCMVLNGRAGTFEDGYAYSLELIRSGAVMEHVNYVMEDSNGFSNAAD